MTRVFWVRSVRAWGPSNGSTACALAGRRCSLWGWRKGVPWGGAFHRFEGRLRSGAPPPLTARPLGGPLGSATHVLWAQVFGCGGPTLSPWPPCPVGAACRGGGGGPSPGGVACHCCEGRLVSGAVPPPAARPLGRGCLGVGAQHFPPGLHALRGLPAVGVGWVGLGWVKASPGRLPTVCAAFPAGPDRAAVPGCPVTRPTGLLNAPRPAVALAGGRCSRACVYVPLCVCGGGGGGGLWHTCLLHCCSALAHMVRESVCLVLQAPAGRLESLTLSPPGEMWAWARNLLVTRTCYPTTPRLPVGTGRRWYVARLGSDPHSLTALGTGGAATRAGSGSPWATRAGGGAPGRRGGGGGPSPGGVACHRCEGRLVSGAVPPPSARPLGRAARVPRPVCPGCGRCGCGDPAPAPRRAPLRAGVARRGGAVCLRVGRLRSGAPPSPAARPLGWLPGPTTHWLWVRGGAGVGTRHQPHSVRFCVLWGWHESARGGHLLPGCGASGVGRSPTPDCPPSGRAAGARYPLAVGVGGCGRGDPSPTPQRALLRAGFARCGGCTRAPGGGASCLGVGRPGSGALPTPTARPLGGLPGPTTHWLWVRGVRAWGPVTNPTARALACCGGGMRVPGGGASCLGVGHPGSGTLPPPTARPHGGLPGPTTHWLWVRGVEGMGTRPQPHSARFCELALRAVGAA